MSETTVYFVRHAQPLHSWSGNDLERPLTEEGVRDVARVTEFFSDKTIDRIYSSPAKRCIDTLRPTADALSLSITTCPPLMERSSGPGGNVLPLFEKRWEDRDFHEPGGESLSQVRLRAVPELQRIIGEREGQTLILGTHGTLFSVLQNHYNPLLGYCDFRRTMNWLPFITGICFEGVRPVSVEEHLHIHKEYKG